MEAKEKVRSALIRGRGQMITTVATLDPVNVSRKRANTTFNSDK